MEVLSSRTILRPRDYDAALEFYGTTLGLAIAREYPGGTVFFAGQGLIEIAAHGGSDEPIRFPPGALWLQVRDVYSAEAELVVAGGIEIVRDARQEPWGGLHELWIADPDGIPPVVLVQIPPRTTRSGATPVRWDRPHTPNVAGVERDSHHIAASSDSPPTRCGPRCAATSRNGWETLQVHKTFAVLLPPPRYRTILRCDR